MHHEKFGKDYAVFDRCYMPSELGCNCTRREVSTDPDTQSWDTVEKRTPGPEVSKSLGREVQSIGGVFACPCRSGEREREMNEI